jgi:sugar phosphate isomerase/epimerase
MRATFDRLLPAAATAGVRLGIEPEIANVVKDAPTAYRLLAELGADAAHVGIVLDPANLLTTATIHRQGDILNEAFDLLGEYVICLHAKDVVDAGYAAAGSGRLDYPLVFRLARHLPRAVPTIIQDASEDDAPRVAAFLRERANP